MNYLETIIKKMSNLIMSITQKDMVYVCRAFAYEEELPDTLKKEHPFHQG
ncbi:cyclic lactone autoinducer peptide [Lysinibacillus sp. FSL H8-0500]|nr:cyclic lactone autoinducer peptide [Lysinibacillus macroides]QPR69104.1 cyclic lactone autoinducer peptide [Lysinibacillus macroides]